MFVPSFYLRKQKYIFILRLKLLPKEKLQMTFLIFLFFFFFFFFNYFSEKIKLDISCELSARQKFTCNVKPYFPELMQKKIKFEMMTYERNIPNGYNPFLP